LLSSKQAKALSPLIFNYAIKKNTKTLIDAIKKVSQEVNAEKTKYMLLSRHQNSEQNHDIRVAKRSFETVTVKIFGRYSNK
jgi:hypothetical protein